VRKLLFRLGAVVIALVALLGMSLPAFALTTADVTVTATPEYLAMTLSDGGTNTWAIGIIAESTTKWYTAAGTAPTEAGFLDSEMKIVITNTGSIAENFKVHGHDFTSGGASWVLSEDDSPSADEVSLRIGFTGVVGEANMTQIIHEDTDGNTPTQLHNVAAAGHMDACLELETGTFSDGVAKSGVITVTCVKHT
jgi:hypothetical protein